MAFNFATCPQFSTMENNIEHHRQYQYQSQHQQQCQQKISLNITNINHTNNLNIFNSFNPSLKLNRFVFVSLIGLYQSWKQCSSTILYDAIFILPLKRQWIFNNNNNNDNDNDKHKFQRFLQDDEFIKLLQWKDKKKLIFYMKDEVFIILNNNLINLNKQQNHIVAPFWIFLSFRLQQIDDPITNKKYKPLILDLEYWKIRYNQKIESKFNVSKELILSELIQFKTMKFKSISEILYQSNPTLNIITSYSNNSNNLNNSKNKMSFNIISNNNLTKIGENFIDLTINDDDDDNDSNSWYISDDYDEIIGENDCDDNNDGDIMMNDKESV